MSAEVSLRDAAEQLGVHYMTAYRYVRSGRLPAHKVEGEWRIRLEDLAQLVAGVPTLVPTGPRRTRHTARRLLEERLVAGDEAGSWRIIEQAMGSGADAEEVLLELISPSLVSIGDRWSAGELDVAAEHQATAVAQRLLARMGPRFVRRGRRRGTVVLGAAPGDRHAIPTALVADLLRGAGFEVVDLGADTPPASFVGCAQRADRLVMVGVCVTNPECAEGAQDVILAVRNASIAVPILVGGSGITTPQEAYDLGADLGATTGREVVAIAEGLVGGLHDRDSGLRSAQEGEVV